MVYKAGDPITLTVSVRASSGKVNLVSAAYSIGDPTGVPAPDSARPPRGCIIPLLPPTQPFAETMMFTGTVPNGIVGGIYKAQLGLIFDVTPTSNTQTSVTAPDRYDVTVLDDPGELIPPEPPPPGPPTIDFL